MADDDNKSGKDSGPKLSPGEMTFRSNLGAAYGTHTGDIYNGMLVSVGGNETLMSEPLIARAFWGYAAVQNAESNYAEKLQNWEKSGKEGDKPQLEYSEPLNAAMRGTEDLKFSAGERTKMFMNAYGAMKVGGAVNAIFGSSGLPRDAPDKVSGLLKKSSSAPVASLGEDSTASKVMGNILQYHIFANGTRAVQQMQLIGRLEQIASEIPEEEKKE